MEPSLRARKKPQQDRSQATVEAIVEAATHIFSTDRFEGATSNIIADRAGVSIGSFYQYFPNKLALLARVRQKTLKELWDTIARACSEACAHEWPAALRHVIAAGMEQHAQRRVLFRLFIERLPACAQEDASLDLARETYEYELRRFFCAHRNSLSVEVDQAVFILPVLGRAIALSALQGTSLRVPQEGVDQLLSVVTPYLSA